MAAPLNYRADVQDGDYFMVESDQLHSFVSQDDLGDDVRSALLNDLGVVVGENVLPIAHWQHESSGPLSVSLNVAGELVMVVSAETFKDQDELLSTLSALEQWLCPMGLRDLSELSGNPTKFVEGLRELGPNLPLASMLRVVLINPSIPIDQAALHATLPFCRLETLLVEALRTSDGVVAIRKVHQAAPIVREEEPVLDVFDDEAELTDLEDISEIDLSDDFPEGAKPQHLAETSVDLDAPDNAAPLLLRGSSYRVDDLPTRFDTKTSGFTPLSDEMFAAGTHLAVVVDLDETVDSPFETSSMFRWDGSERLHGLFERHCTDEQGRKRTVHLFVERAATDDRVSYIGTVANCHGRAADQEQSLWLELDARSPVTV